MFFSSRYSPHIRSQQLTNGDWSELAGLFGVSIDSLQISGSSSLNEVTTYTCIKILSESVAKLPLKIYQDDGSGAEKSIKDYRYNLLKLRPNPYMSAYDFWRVLEVLRNIHGNSYALIDSATTGRNAGQIQGLYPVKSENMTVYVDDMGLLSGKNRVWYKYRDDMGGEILLDSESVLHFKGMSLNGIIGLSPIEYLRLTIENAKSASTYLNSSYKKGLQTGGILQYTGDLGPDEQSTLRGKYEQMLSGLGNANRLSVIPLGLSYQPISLKMTDAQFLENTRLTIQQLTAAYGIKPHQVNDQTKTSYSSTSEANREFYTDTLLSNLTMYEQEINYKTFLSKEIAAGYYAKFNADVILRADAEKRYITYSQSVQNMILTPNEARAKEDLPPKDGGDVLYGNAALAPATLLAEGIAFKKGGSENA